MAGRHAQRKTRTRGARVRRRAAVVGLSTTAGAFLAAAANPFAAAPPARADFEDLVLDLLDPGVIAAAAEVASTATLVDPTALAAGVDVDWMAALPDLAAQAASAMPAAVADP